MTNKTETEEAPNFHEDSDKYDDETHQGYLADGVVVEDDCVHSNLHKRI